MSQGYCESRSTIYDERAKPVLSVFYFLIKRVHVFYKGWLVFFATRVGRSYLQLEKKLSTILKKKNKK